MTIFLLIFLIALVIYSLLIDYYRRAWNRIPIIEIQEVKNVHVSVIVAVRNEEANLPELLARLSDQDFPKTLFEVIVVDDHSTDNTLALLTSSSPNEFPLKVLRLPEGTTSKKKASKFLR